MSCSNAFAFKRFTPVDAVRSVVWIRAWPARIPSAGGLTEQRQGPCLACYHPAFVAHGSSRDATSGTLYPASDRSGLLHRVLGRQLVTWFPRVSGSRIDGMPHRITRERMIEAIRELPEDASVDDAIERLVFLAKIEEGLAQLDRGEGIPHDEVKRRLGL